MEEYSQVKDCMKTGVVSIHVNTSVGEAAALVVDKRVGTLPVVDDEGKLIGVVTIKSIMKYFLPEFVSLLDNIDFIKDFGAVKSPSDETTRRIASLTMTDIMKEPVAVESDSSLIKSLAMMEKHHLWDLPIVEGGKLIGIVSRVDIVRAFFLELQANEINGGQNS